jgi:hypothetical protein
MIGIGCLAPLVLFVAGALAGHAVIGSSGVAWGAEIGFLSGLAMLGVLGWVIDKAKRQ